MLPSPQRTVIRCATLISCTGTDPVSDAALVIEDGHIVAAGPAADVPVPAGAEVVEYPECAVMPGLIDGHVHMMYRRDETIYDHAQRFDDHQLLVRSAHHAQRLVAAGVTTVRDCGSRGTFLQALRDGITDGLLPGPRLLVSGPPITTTVGHLWVCGGEVDSGEQARALVRRLVKQNVDLIKVMATGGRMTPGSNVGRAQFSVEELRLVVDDAHRLGRQVAMHCLGTEGIARAVQAGANTIEHCLWYGEDGTHHVFDEGVARQMAEQGTYCNMASQPVRALAEKTPDQPLSSAEQLQLEIFEERWRWFRRGVELGVPSFFSTDAIFGQWGDECSDLRWLLVQLAERAGIPNADALRMVTSLPAQALGLDNLVGSLAPGRLADLLVVRGNPVQRIRNIHNVVAVYQAGRLADSRTLGLQ